MNTGLSDRTRVWSVCMCAHICREGGCSWPQASISRRARGSSSDLDVLDGLGLVDALHDAREHLARPELVARLHAAIDQALHDRLPLHGRRHLPPPRHGLTWAHAWSPGHVGTGACWRVHNGVHNGSWRGHLLGEDLLDDLGVGVRLRVDVRDHRDARLDDLHLGEM